MNNRDEVRYDAGALPAGMGRACLAWQEHAAIGAQVVNYSAHGIRVSIAPSQYPSDIPQKKDLVRVRMPVDEQWFSGMCVFATREQDGSLSLGVYFYKPEEQNYLKSLLFNSLGTPCPENTFVSYQWEELITRLCSSEDPRLKEMGEEKRRALRLKMAR